MGFEGELLSNRTWGVCTTWGVKGKDLFLLGVFRRRLEYPALKRAIREQQSLFDAQVRADRRQGLRHAANPGADRRWLSWRHPLPADDRQGHAFERANDADRMAP